MKNRISLRAALLATLLACSAATTLAAPAAKPVPNEDAIRVGLGQERANEPAKLGNLRLTDPLVQQKYLNEPDMLRFLRGTYSEACTRGLVDKAAKQISADLKREFSADQRQTAGRMLESRRIWKMTSFEMEALYGPGYLNAANYCDCLMREVSDIELVNPRKGLEVIEKLSQGVQRACESNAQDQTTRQLKAREKKK
jgi:hypothetical protein